MIVKNEMFNNDVFLDALNKVNDFDEFPIKDALILYKLSKELFEHKEAFEAQKSRLIKKYGESDGDVYQIPPDKIEGFVNELDELLSIDVEISLQEKFVLSDYSFKLSPNHLFVLENLFDFSGIE